MTGDMKAPALTYISTMSTTPSRKFMNEPAQRMMSFFQKLWLGKALGSSDSSSSPIAQKPPMGRMRRAYRVSPFCFFQIAGPMPMANSSTLTPQAFAVMKCPNSCMAIKTPNIMIAIIIYIRKNAP